VYNTIQLSATFHFAHSVDINIFSYSIHLQSSKSSDYAQLGDEDTDEEEEQ